MHKKQEGTGERLETSVFNETTIEHLHRYAIALEFVPDKNVLDIACGEGYGANLLAGKATKVTGVDKDDAVIKEAAGKYKKENLSFITGQAEAIPLAENSYDIVTSFETIEHVADQSKMLGEIKRVLKPGGLLIISTPNKKTYSDNTGRKNPHHTKELYEDEFASLLKKYFSNIEILKQETMLSSFISGSKQTALAQFEGDYDSIKSVTAAEGLYFVAFASDSDIPVINSSLYKGQSVYQNILKEREDFVANTITYRTGHFILYPFKLIRKLFGKKR